MNPVRCKIEGCDGYIVANEDDTVISCNICGVIYEQ